MRSSKRDTDVKNRLSDYAGEGKGGMIWENSTELCILPYVKYMTGASSMHEVGTQSQCSGTIQRDGVGREVGGELRMRRHMWPMSDLCQCMVKSPQCCKEIILQLNKLIFFSYRDA